MAERQPLDIVYTWVDDAWPGYLAQLNEHAADPRDLNPNRTRDNLELLRFSMRSVWRDMQPLGTVHLFTARPQCPTWLDPGHPMIRLHHHDEVMAERHLPTFSSFGIVSHLHLLPGLAEDFVYFEDDILSNSNDLRDVLQVDGTPQMFFSRLKIRRDPDPATDSPWNLALAHAARLLDEGFGPRDRYQIGHTPLRLTKTLMAEALASYPEAVEATRAAKFRSAESIPPEVLVPSHLCETGQAVRAPRAVARRVEGYVSLENLLPWSWAQLAMLDLRKPLSIALNDGFGANPNPRVVAMVRRWLERRYPDPAPWEKA